MKEKKLKLIDENNSPLFRIMSVYNSTAPNKAFANNVCAFHIGKGIIISVAHSLRAFDRLPIILSDSFYQNELLSKIKPVDTPEFDQVYPLDIRTNERRATGVNPENGELFIKKLDEAKVDRRYSTLYSENCCKPFLVTTFRNNAFCNEPSLNQLFPANYSFHEPALNRYTFLIELRLLDVFIKEDLAIYKIINTPIEIINKLPSIDIDFELYDTGTPDYYCLQSAPYDNLGRIINEARIEGLIDNFASERDVLGNMYMFEGSRYLIKGYFRFGSSGAAYLKYDREQEKFRANAVQSQASFIQLSIDNKMEGNLQYVNGIASPLCNIQEQIEQKFHQSEVI